MKIENSKFLKLTLHYTNFEITTLYLFCYSLYFFLQFFVFKENLKVYTADMVVLFCGNTNAPHSSRIAQLE